MKKLFVSLWVVFLVGCAGVVKIEGDQQINGRMSVNVSDAWNKVSAPGATQPFDAWTQEGLTLDHLRLWAGIESGQSLMSPVANRSSGQTAPRVPTFKAGMPPDQLVNLFEVMYSADGSIFTLSKVESAKFAGEKGVRFEFSVSRKSDDVQLRGVAWVAVHNNELYAVSFVAPRMSFFPRLLPKVEAVVATARIKG